MHPRHIALHAVLILLLLAPAAALAGGSENEETVMPAAAPEITAVPFVPSALGGAPLETVPPQTRLRRRAAPSPYSMCRAQAPGSS